MDNCAPDLLTNSGFIVARPDDERTHPGSVSMAINYGLGVAKTETIRAFMGCGLPRARHSLRRNERAGRQTARVSKVESTLRFAGGQGTRVCLVIENVISQTRPCTPYPIRSNLSDVLR